MSQVTFEVIDTACESGNRTFFPPRVGLSTVSTTIIGTLLGFPEFPQFVSNPPKKYHTLAWTGTSEHQLWFNGVQIGGAKFVYSGQSTIDTFGNYTSLYGKELSEECTAADNMITSVTTGPGGSQSYGFQGWCGPAGHQRCSPCNLPYLDQGNRAIGTGPAAVFDVSNLWGGLVDQFGKGRSNFIVNSSTNGSCVESGTAQLPSLFDPIAQNATVPTDGSFFFIPEVIYTHNYSATLSTEYTEAEALTHGITYTGTSNVSAYLRELFTVTQTTVAFTLAFTNLIPNQNYIATYQLWDSATGVSTTVTNTFQAAGTTFSIVGTIPLPAEGHSTQIRFPTVTFA